MRKKRRSESEKKENKYASCKAVSATSSEDFSSSLIL